MAVGSVKQKPKKKAGNSLRRMSQQLFGGGGGDKKEIDANGLPAKPRKAKARKPSRMPAPSTEL